MRRQPRPRSPAVGLALLARRRGVRLGVGLRHGALGEFGRGALFSVVALLVVPFAVQLTGVFGLSRRTPAASGGLIRTTES